MTWLESFNALRIKSGMNLDELSAKSGVPKSTLSKISAGITKNPSIETMKDLVHAMGYTLDDLDKKEKTVTIESDDLSETDLQFVKMIQQLTDQEKTLLLAVMKSLIDSRGQ